MESNKLDMNAVTAPPPSESGEKKKIRITVAEAKAMKMPVTRKKKIAFLLLALFVAAALGNVLWFTQDFWLSYWFPERDSGPIARIFAPSEADSAVKAPSADDGVAEAPSPTPASAPAIAYLSAVLWEHPGYREGVRLFNAAVDDLRAYVPGDPLTDPLARCESGAIEAARQFAALRDIAPTEVRLADYILECRRLVEEARRLAAAAEQADTAEEDAPAAPQRTAGATATRPGGASPSAAAEPPLQGPWQHPSYQEGARLFNQALARYRQFLANKSRVDLLKSIEDDAFQAAKLFEGLKTIAPAGVPLGDNITQCYKLISDCRRQNLESGGAASSSAPGRRATTGPRHRPALPAWSETQAP